MSLSDCLVGTNPHLNPGPHDSVATLSQSVSCIPLSLSPPPPLLCRFRPPPTPRLRCPHPLHPASPPPRVLPSPSSSASSEPEYATPGALAAAPRPGPHYGPALIAACITLFHFKESAEKPVPGRQQKVKTQLTPIRALSQAPREVMKYGSGEICNALLSGLSYNGVHANYACRLPPAPGRGPPSARPARARAGWRWGGREGGEEKEGGAREEWGRGKEGRTRGKGEGRVGRKRMEDQRIGEGGGRRRGNTEEEEGQCRQ